MKRLIPCLVVLLALGATAGHAGLVTVDPDAFADGTNITNAFPGVTLQTYEIWSPAYGDVYAVDASTVAMRGVVPLQASTGQNVFNLRPPAQFPRSVGDLDFRVDFQEPTNFVSLDFIGSNTGFDEDEIGIGEMSAYDSSDVQLAIVTTALAGGLKFNIVETLTISRPTRDIAYTLARRRDDNAVAVDHLVFNDVPEPASAVLVFLGFGAVASRVRRRLRVG